MVLFDFMKNKKPEAAPVEVKCEPGTLYLPVGGKVIPLQEINDGVFSDGVLGPGCGIIPKEETVYAPAGGTVCQVAETLHAVGVRTEDGAEVLIHVGMDTVEMNGEGFTALVKQDQKVCCGDPLMKFSMDKIKAAGHPVTTAFIVTNPDEFAEISVIHEGDAEKLSPVIRIRK